MIEKIKAFFAWIKSKLGLDKIFDDIIQTMLSIENDYELVEQVMMHLIL